jgi:PAS domain S-box-containing protein
MEERKRKSGIDILGDIPWGTHLCQFYQTKGDLIDILVPYFKAGLENNEFCMWITSEPLITEEAEKSLRKAVKNLDKYIKRDQIEIMDYSQWYTKSGKFAADKVLRGWVNKENEAVKRGFDGLRLAGNTFWLKERDWRDFADYEVTVNNVIGKYRMLAVCPYSLDKSGASEVIDVVNSHQFALIRRGGKWEIIESSERKKAEIALKEKEEFNFTLFQYNPIQTIIADNEGKVIKTNLAKRNSGDRLPNIGDVMYRDYAGKHEIDMRAELMECIRTGKKKDFAELKYGDKFLNVTIAPFPQGAIITSQDITERKRAEDEIKRRNEELATLNAIAATVSSSLNLQEILDRALDKMLEVAGVEVGSIYLLDQQAKELVLATYRGVPKEFANKVRTFKMGESLTGRVGQSGEPIVTDDLTRDHRVTTTVVSKAGIRSMASLPIKSKDKVLGAINLASHKYHRFSPEEIRLYVAVANQIGVAVENGWLYQRIKQELAERKRSEQELKESEEKYRTLTYNVNVSVFRNSPGPNGRFIEVNPEILKMFGYESKKEFFKLNVSDLYQNPEERKKFSEKMLRDGSVKNEELQLKKKDGTPITCSVSAVAVKDEKGRARYFDGIIEDITERKRVEKEIKESREQIRNFAAHLGSAREQERTVIAREIHDELGQSLTALKMDLSWLYKKMPRDKALLPKRTKSMLGLVDTTIQSVKRISSELRPGLLDDIGVSAAIEWQGEEFQNHTGIRCEVNVEPEDIILDQERSIAIFRIFQEALTNIARHAKATRVKASLKTKAGKLELKVRDNGRGIEEEKISDPKSFGLIGIRERAQFLDGTVEIRGIRDKGTTITVRIPLPEKGKNDKNPHRG